MFLIKDLKLRTGHSDRVTYASLYFADAAAEEKEAIDASGEPWRPLSNFTITDNPYVKHHSIAEVWRWTLLREEYRTEYARLWVDTATGIDEAGLPTGMVGVILCPVGPGECSIEARGQCEKTIQKSGMKTDSGTRGSTSVRLCTVLGIYKPVEFTGLSSFSVYIEPGRSRLLARMTVDDDRSRRWIRRLTRRSKSTNQGTKRTSTTISCVGHEYVDIVLLNTLIHIDDPKQYRDAPVSLQLVGRRYEDEKLIDTLEFMKESIGLPFVKCT